MRESSDGTLADTGMPRISEAAVRRRLRKSFYCLLVIGLAVHLLALNRPLLDGQMWRQTQTALITQGIAQQGGWHAGAVATWRGDWPARLVLEFPAYNYLVIALYKIFGNLDACGKVASVLLWAA